MSEAQPYQSLYRRYRSQTFNEVIGQDHITNGLKAAVAEGRNGHAYLFSGPRGTGKTSTARVLAKALNCENIADGEPCNECESCVAITEGRSFDLHELDAASNNKVDDVRDLISKVHLGSPGRTKVYILDEVHMLSSGAENALLKTLEEPPEHVVFVLATTEPHKVVPTIRSRTQQYKFNLIGAEQLSAHVKNVATDAGLEVTQEMVDYVIAEGAGSARDTLSALDAVVAAGGVPGTLDATQAVLESVIDKDPGAALAAVQQSLEFGLEPRVIGEDLLSSLRNCFLHSMGVELTHVTDTERANVAELTTRTKPSDLTEALEQLGTSLVDMRQAADPRVCLEVALLKICRTSQPEPVVATQPAQESAKADAPRQRVERPAETSAPKASAVKPEVVQAKEVAPPPSPRAAKPAQESVAEPAPQTPLAVAETPVQATTNVAQRGATDLESAYKSALADVSQKVRVRFKPCELVSIGESEIQLSSPNEVTQSRCEEVVSDLQQSVSKMAGRDVTISFAAPGTKSETGAAPTQTKTAPAEAPQSADSIDLDGLTDASSASGTSFDRIKQVFPAAKVVSGDSPS